MTSAHKLHPPGKLIFLLIVAVVFCLGLLAYIKPFRFISLAPSISSKMNSLVLERDNIEFSYPENWVAQLTPQGNHGDEEVIAIILAPARFSLSVTVSRKEFINTAVSEVAAWGEARAQSGFFSYDLDTLAPYSSKQFSGLISEYVVRTGAPLETEDIHCKDLYFMNQQDGYAFSFCETESYWNEVSPIFDKIINSIQVWE